MKETKLNVSRHFLFNGLNCAVSLCRKSPDDTAELIVALSECMLYGSIVVKAPSLSKEAIILAIEEGSFYSSTGPEILSFEVKNNVVSVTCSEVNKIEFITYEHHGHTEWAQGESLTEASYKLNGDEKYVRVVCVELNGKTAWSNPIFLDW